MNDLDALQLLVEEHFDPGEPVEVLIGVPEEVSQDKAQEMQRYMNERGLDAKVAFGSSVDWPNTIRLEFTRPQNRRVEAKFLPLALLVIGALGVAGVGLILGFKIGGVLDQVGKNLVPLILILVGGIVLVSAVGGAFKAGPVEVHGGR